MALSGPTKVSTQATDGVSGYPDQRWTAECHSREQEVTAEVNEYFLQHWPFPDEKARKKFVKAGFSRVTCFYVARALDDRIQFACRLLTVLFLIDDLLEHMSLEDGRAYNEKLMPICRGDVAPDRNVPVEYILYDLWEDMRAHDRPLANDILEPCFSFMRAQTDVERLTDMDVRAYLKYREADVGGAFLSALMRFAMGINATEEDLDLLRPIYQNCAKHISVMNDIWSYEKEVLAAETLHPEGGVLCSAVDILVKAADIPAAAAKRVLYTLLREWESMHEAMAQEILEQNNTEALATHIKGLELQMSGNETWSRTTERYLSPNDLLSLTWGRMQ